MPTRFQLSTLGRNFVAKCKEVTDIRLTLRANRSWPSKQRGVRFGRPRKLNPDQAQVATQLLWEGKAFQNVARTFKVHEATIYYLDAS